MSQKQMKVVDRDSVIVDVNCLTVSDLSIPGSCARNRLVSFRAPSFEFFICRE
ncbi:MAG: hypothetical protein U0169_05020 [Polyangiaceae bacterium]